jgi:hypothetical protein
MKRYLITHIGKDGFNRKVMTEPEAARFFQTIGFEFWVAAKQLIPEFVVQEFKGDNCVQRQRTNTSTAIELRIERSNPAGQS